jgi:leader peptidase (prepilin peptidase)/N-methyltransferase
MFQFLCALLGYFVGVLINRAADNLPLRRSLIAAPQCAYCGTARGVREQFAVASFLLGRGRCPNCHAPLPLRAPIVEILSAALGVFLWSRYELSVSLALAAVYSALLLLILVVDLEHKLILNVVSLPAIGVALALSPFSAVGWLRAGLGGLFGFLVVFGIYLLGDWIARGLARARGTCPAVSSGTEIREIAFGFGDVKLAAFVGLIVGLPAMVLTLILTILLGGLAALIVLAYEFIVHRRYAGTMAIPYGPFFCIAGWVFLVWGREILRWYTGG